MSRIGIMGGTFNPIHVGHLLLAECAREEKKLDEVWFIPTGISYMKKQSDVGCFMPDSRDRLEMTKLAIKNHPHFRCLSVEVDREGNTYSYETLEWLRQKYPENEFFFLFGADCLYSIENWKEPMRIFRACEIVAAVRGDASTTDMYLKIEDLNRRFGARISLLPFRNIEISSTEIRNLVSKGKSIRYMVPDLVVSYIEAKGFYKDETD